MPVLNILLQDLQSEEIILAILSHYNALAKKATPDGKNEKKELAEIDKRIGTTAGKRDQLSGKIQEVYGTTKEDVEKQIADWQAIQKDSECCGNSTAKSM